jgi:hypothetical protein
MSTREDISPGEGMNLYSHGTRKWSIPRVRKAGNKL